MFPRLFWHLYRVKNGPGFLPGFYAFTGAQWTIRSAATSISSSLFDMKSGTQKLRQQQPKQQKRGLKRQFSSCKCQYLENYWGIMAAKSKKEASFTRKHFRSSATFLPTVNPHYYVESQDIYFLGNEHKNKVKWIAWQVFLPLPRRSKSNWEKVSRRSFLGRKSSSSSQERLEQQKMHESSMEETWLLFFVCLWHFQMFRELERVREEYAPNIS